MSKILFVLVTLLVVTIATDSSTTSATTKSPSTTAKLGDSTLNQQNQNPAIIGLGIRQADHDQHDETHSVQKRQDSHLPPAAHQVTFSTIKPQPVDTDSSQSHTGNACVQNYEPVCGSNGKTYSNVCMLNLSQKTEPTLVVAKKGEC